MILVLIGYTPTFLSFRCVNRYVGPAATNVLVCLETKATWLHDEAVTSRFHQGNLLCNAVIAFFWSQTDESCFDWVHPCNLVSRHVGHVATKSSQCVIPETLFPCCRKKFFELSPSWHPELLRCSCQSRSCLLRQVCHTYSFSTIQFFGADAPSVLHWQTYQHKSLSFLGENTYVTRRCEELSVFDCDSLRWCCLLSALHTQDSPHTSRVDLHF